MRERLDPPEEDEGIECPECGGHGWNANITCKIGCPVPIPVPEQCSACNGLGRVFGDAAASHLEDLEEMAADRKRDR